MLKPEGSFNNQWGLPLTLLRLGPEHKALALELGANTPGEIASLAAICRPTVGAVTVVSSAHTEFFGSLDGVAAEKSALVRAIPPDGAVVLNADDPRVLAMHTQSRARVLYFGTRPGADVFAAGPAEDDGDGLRFTLAAGTARRPVRLHFAGRHNVVNALAAAGIGLALGLALEQIARGLEAARPAKGRCVWRRAGALRILDDTYNANPTSVRAALDTLRRRRATRGGGWWCWATCSSWARSARPRTATWAARSPRRARPSSSAWAAGPRPRWRRRGRPGSRRAIT